MPVMMRQHFLGSLPFADVVHESGKARFDRLRLSRYDIDDLHRMAVGVALGMILGRLGLSLQGEDFREHRFQEARVRKSFKKKRGLRRGKRTRKLVHDALCRFFLKLCRTIRHQRPRAIFDDKSQFRRLTRCTKSPHGVFGKMMRRRANHAMRKVTPSTVGIDEFHRGQAISHAVDARITAKEIIFDRDFRPKIYGKSAIAMPRLPLATREGNFRAYAVDFYEIDRKGVTDEGGGRKKLCESLPFQPRDDEVLIPRRCASKMIAHPAADEVDRTSRPFHCLDELLLTHTRLLHLRHISCVSDVSKFSHHAHQEKAAVRVPRFHALERLQPSPVPPPLHSPAYRR